MAGARERGNVVETSVEMAAAETPPCQLEGVRRRYRMLPGNRLVPHDAGIVLFNPASMPVTRYRYRGGKIPNPWTEPATTTRTSG